MDQISERCQDSKAWDPAQGVDSGYVVNCSNNDVCKQYIINPAKSLALTM